jgi:hypothetical protein
MLAIGIGATGLTVVSEDHAWIIAAALLAGLTFAAYVLVEVIHPIVRRYPSTKR